MKSGRSTIANEIAKVLVSHGFSVSLKDEEKQIPQWYTRQEERLQDLAGKTEVQIETIQVCRGFINEDPPTR